MLLFQARRLSTGKVWQWERAQAGQVSGAREAGRHSRNRVRPGREPGRRSGEGERYLLLLEASGTSGSDLWSEPEPPNKALPQAFAEYLRWPGLADSPGGKWGNKMSSCPCGAHRGADKNMHDVFVFRELKCSRDSYAGDVPESTVGCVLRVTSGGDVRPEGRLH